MKSQILCMAFAVMAKFMHAVDVYAHCDSMDGLVIKDAQRALSEKVVTAVMKWVPKKSEEEIRQAFSMVQAIRGESEDVRKVADNYFFETLVRAHRTGEGEDSQGSRQPEVWSRSLLPLTLLWRMGTSTRLPRRSQRLCATR